MPHPHNDRIEHDWYVTENLIKGILQGERHYQEVARHLEQAKERGWEIPLHIKKLLKMTCQPWNL